MRGATHRQRTLLLGLVSVGVFSISCGYKLVDYQNPPEGLRSVTIRTFDNESYEPGIEVVVADAMRREFLRRGGLPLFSDPETADLVVSGSVLRIQSQALTFSSVALALEFQVTLALRVVATLRDGTLIPVDNRAMVESERYLASADIEATRKNREEAFRKLSAVLAARTHDMLVEVYVQ